MPFRARAVTLAATLVLATDLASANDLDEPDPADLDASGCDSSAGGDVAELVEDQPADRTIPTPMPERWRESAGRQCRTYRGRSFCDGPLRAPEPSGAARDLALRLGLDETVVGRVALTGPARAEWLAAVEGQVGAGLLWPVPEGRLWRGYGRHRTIVRPRGGRLQRGHSRVMHNGVDIGAAAGAAIRAVNDGLVIYSFNGMRGYGNTVLLLHRDATITLYAHCRATYVFAGQQVRRGQVIAEVGASGLAHGPHLHFEWRRNGRARDPLAHFVGAPSEAEPPAP